jgi:cytochrome c oxidase subunit 2
MRRSGILLALLVLAGCVGNQSALDPRGVGARLVGDLFWLFLAVSTLVLLLVSIGLAWGLARRRRAAEAAVGPLEPSPRERAASTVIVIATTATALTLFVLTGFSYVTGKTIADLTGSETVTLRITGHQWWWEIRYEDPDASRSFTTANEIHIPVGEAVKVKLEASDVIHSFWVPNLSGKRDLIPGRQTELTLLAEEAGAYRAQCAEFCGLQHAKMAMMVIAEDRASFDRWVDGQIAAAAPPGSDRQVGLDLFMARGCAMCHGVRGSPAGGRVAPDLTHVASRTTLAAGALPMTHDALSAWIADAQHFKPGSNMPPMDLSPDELSAIVAYVEGLK